jgi:hypothetical protein
MWKILHRAHRAEFTRVVPRGYNWSKMRSRIDLRRANIRLHFQVRKKIIIIIKSIKIHWIYVNSKGQESSLSSNQPYRVLVSSCVLPSWCTHGHFYLSFFSSLIKILWDFFDVLGYLLVRGLRTPVTSLELQQLKERSSERGRLSHRGVCGQTNSSASTSAFFEALKQQQLFNHQGLSTRTTF